MNNQVSESAGTKAIGSPLFRASLVASILLCLFLIGFGAFVRLQHAGLGCPDWPTCYGKISWPKHDLDVVAANMAFPERPVEHAKTWPEQVHRHIATVLGIIVLTLTLLAVRRQARAVWPIFVAMALLLISVPLYIKQFYVSASFMAIAGELILLAQVIIQRNQARWLCLCLFWICIQGTFGLWTVTWKLKPFIVTAHLLGGLAMILLLLWTWLRSRNNFMAMLPKPQRLIPGAILLLAFGVLTAQIALGGWVSTNYAAWACPDFPTCQGQWLPSGADFGEAFVLWRGIGVNYEGGILDANARIAIHLVHRIGAIIATLVLATVAILAVLKGLKLQGIALLVALTTQIALGVGNIVWALPLPVAVGHTMGAALLAMTLIWLIASACYPSAQVKELSL